MHTTKSRRIALASIAIALTFAGQRRDSPPGGCFKCSPVIAPTSTSTAQFGHAAAREGST